MLSWGVKTNLCSKYNYLYPIDEEIKDKKAKYSTFRKSI